MYLKELRLQGFKSFADPTRLDLRRGVTAIVGPNGCGKSNIADAIRWVLGEQSAKSLRAGAMQDVIFQGTSNRKPVNLCQVSLIFADCEDRLGDAYNEVEVTRKVVRDGGSDYYLNGKACRLKDIQRLFLDTGIGQVSYSFMLQGQIDQVLSSNPSERRAIFEEAAGISRYKAQRREALSKLTQVDANLARVTDVMEEVARQTGSLKRQAAKAMRYQRIHHRLVHLDLAHSAWQFSQLNTECKAQRQKTEVLAAEMERVAVELRAMEADLGSKREQVQALRSTMESAQQKVYQLRSEKETASNRREMAQARIADLNERAARLQDELRLLAEEEDAIAAKLAGEARLKQEQLSLFGNSDEDFQRRSADLTELQKRVGQAEGDLSRNKQALLVKEGSISRLRSNVTSLELDLKTYQVRHANLTEEIYRLNEERELAIKDRDTIERAREARSAERDTQSARMVEFKSAQQELTAQFRALQQQIQEKDRSRASLKAQVNVLQDLQAKLEGFSEGTRAVLQGKLDTVVGREDLLVLLEQVRVQDGFSGAIEQLLGAAADGIYLSKPAALPAIAAQLRDKRLGKASFVVAAAAADTAAKSALGALPTGIRSALSLVRSEHAEIQRFLESFLNGCVVTDDLQVLLDHMAAHPDWKFSCAVTLEGEWVDGRGVIIVGAAGNKKPNSSFLGRQQQIKSLSAQLTQLDDEIERARLQTEQLQSRMDANDKRVEEQNALISELQQELTTLAAQREAAERGLRQGSQTLEAKTADLDKLESGKEASTAKLTAAKAELDAIENDIAGLKQAITEVEQQTEGLRHEREAMREQFNEARFEIAQKRQRLELLDRGLEELKRKSAENATGRQQRGAELESIAAQVKSLQAQGEEQALISSELDAALQKHMQALDRDRSALAEADQRLAVLDQGLAPKREAQARFSAEHNKAEVQFARLESRLQFLVEECQRNYERNPLQILWQHELWQAGDALPERIRVEIEEDSPEEVESVTERPDPTEEQLAELESGVDWETIGKEVQSLRQREQSMGPVNLSAIGEYKELKERHDFLSAQSSDLWKAKDELLKAIDEINATSQQMFAETFASIRTNFHFTFDKLFGGGRADLQLVDSGDVLESGIDITAQPPGTRLSSIGLLSGGQKTMTAVALLFAIYMVKPSPFCVLDEIDAPLDDANIGRFTDMLEGFLEFSQFLIITHNKRTIKVADTIYGATMQEKGVSRMISMRFNRATGDAEISQEVSD